MIPTPTASDSKRSLTQAERDRKEGATLHEGVARLMARGMLPTPTATDCKASGTAGNWTEGSGRNAGATLTDVAVRGLDTPSKSSGESPSSGEPTGNGGLLLNPRFVEWMMGLPTGWALVSTSTPSNFTSSATASSRSQRAQRSAPSGTASTAQISLFPTTKPDSSE